MEIQLAFALILIHGVHSTVFTIKNNCPYNIAPATWTWRSRASVLPTGFVLESGASKNIDIPRSWFGQVWARFECSNDGAGRFHCNSGDCGSDQVECNGGYATSPASTIVFVIGDAIDGKDSYGLSLDNGFNLPVSIVPQGDCEMIDCPVDINDECPPELAVKGASGTTIGCKSACAAFDKPEYCCYGDYDTPDTCPPTDYSRFFKNLCPKTYTYAYDNSTISYTCKTGTNYVITFCL
ncbi:thaumatin [Artemisia annua]|uniref:Thaumatin n=1 Tax=Artemisia annua TaxID=35608 RepID=A0A2U1PMS9_ARTAN|nr:thaumatin [Artemisia annua]